MKLETIKIAKPFNHSFIMIPQILNQIQEHIKHRSYDKPQLMIVLAELSVVTDGHTPVEGAKNIGLEKNSF